MPRAFDITAATESVNLNAAGQGELAFTVSNALRAQVRARATVMMDGQARREWASISGGEERDFAPDGTQQFTVRFQVPPGTPPGRYTFHLLVSDVGNPDEQYADGPTVSFVVPEAAPVQKKAFPWWIVALAVGVLIIVGGVVAILAGRGGPDLGEPCAEGGACGKGLACSAPEGGVCLGEDGFKGCKENGQCLSARCEGKVCEKAELGRNCGPGDTCPAQQKCAALLGTKTCLAAPGEDCTGDGQCTSLYCKDGKCMRDDGKCDTNDECRAPSQCHTNKLCLLPNGQDCTSNGVCISGFCQSGKCQQAPTACPGPCPPFSSCIAGRCVRIDRLPRVNEELQRVPNRGVILVPRHP